MAFVRYFLGKKLGEGSRLERKSTSMEARYKLDCMLGLDIN